MLHYMSLPIERIFKSRNTAVAAFLAVILAVPHTHSHRKATRAQAAAGSRRVPPRESRVSAII